ncbi:uncharacterized protein LOC122667363 [Telopea speciosissima]|uniref:uncharacterized protein LOC122667363 n=1 Tax=Telopea speciosissima TaxID=54955 RepID=UPI001CC62D26|nr:uncharacterized protein LOC122667363 [Telopea speciosissima]
MPQPYTRSQLSKKLRRLRKKFRIISTRISVGLDPSLLAPHDRALFDLSNQLWHPSYASSSPFQSNKRKPSKEDTELNLENNLGSGHEEEPYLLVGEDGGGLGRFAAKTIMDSFDRSLKAVKMILVRQELLYADQTSTSSSTPAESSKQGRAIDFEKRWREQRAEKLDVMACSLRLLLENAINQR